jgi:hypothetical protein
MLEASVATKAGNSCRCRAWFDSNTKVDGGSSMPPPSRIFNPGRRGGGGPLYMTPASGRAPRWSRRVPQFDSLEVGGPRSSHRALIKNASTKSMSRPRTMAQAQLVPDRARRRRLRRVTNVMPCPHCLAWPTGRHAPLLGEVTFCVSGPQLLIGARRVCRPDDP